MKKKKIALATLAGAIMLGTGAANAAYQPDDYGIFRSVFNPTFRTMQNEWAVQAGFAFQTGSNKTGSNQISIAGGDFDVGDVKVAYGVLDELYVSIDVYRNTFEVNPFTGSFMIGSFANPEIGINWQIMRPAKSFALDLIGKYGLAWTIDQPTGQRIGMNNLQAGLRIYGDEGKFQWAAQALGQWVSIPDSAAFTDNSMWNLLMKAEIEFEIIKTVALKAEGNYNIYNLAKDTGEAMIYDRNALLGVVVDVSPGAAIMPYVSYHFQTANSEDSDTLPNNFWQIGAKFGMQF